MLKRIVLAVLLLCPVTSAWSVDVIGIVACKQDGETWLCGAYENDKLKTFRSERYISKVEFSGAIAKPLDSALIMPKKSSAPVPASMMTSEHSSSDALPREKYTLQLLACNTPACRKRLAAMNSISGSQVVEIKNQGKLWDVLIVGGYPSTKAAQQAAADLIKRHGLKAKPWVRTVESIRSRLITN
ncbi:MAG: SPOR domain-containing protein [Motiliproteus sp.]